MGRVTVLASGFTGSYQGFNGNYTLNITKSDIARGIVTIGKTHWLQYFRDPIEILNDWIHNITGLNTFITSKDGNLCINERFHRLDPSDQRIKSYNIGIGIAKIVVSKVLNIPYLQHIDYLVDQGIATITTGSKQRGDLAGMDNYGKWHVVEAKGSSYSFSRSKFDYAKQQATRIQSISGSPPNTNSYCCTSFDQTGMTVFLADPDNDNQIRLVINPEQFILSYYKKLYLNISAANIVNVNIGIPQIENFRPVFYRATDTIVIGILSSIIDGLKDNSIRFLEILSTFSEVIKTFESNYISIGEDGIILIDEQSR